MSTGSTKENIQCRIILLTVGMDNPTHTRLITRQLPGEQDEGLVDIDLGMIEEGRSAIHFEDFYLTDNHRQPIAFVRSALRNIISEKEALDGLTTIQSLQCPAAFERIPIWRRQRGDNRQHVVRWNIPINIGAAVEEAFLRMAVPLDDGRSKVVIVPVPIPRRETDAKFFSNIEPEFSLNGMDRQLFAPFYYSPEEIRLIPRQKISENKVGLDSTLVENFVNAVLGDRASSFRMRFWHAEAKPRQLHFTQSNPSSQETHLIRLPRRHVFVFQFHNVVTKITFSYLLKVDG